MELNTAVDQPEHNRFTSKCFDTDTDVEIDGLWRDAIKMSILRAMEIPREIVNDFMVTKGLWEEETNNKKEGV